MMITAKVREEKDTEGREVFRERERESHRQTALIDDGKITKEKSGQRMKKKDSSIGR